MKFTWTKGLVSLVALFLLAVIPASAQMVTGTVTGTVADTSGAVIPGATVRLTNQDTGVTREITTDDTGRFSFVRVRAGTYTLSVGKEGFRTHEVRDLEVDVGKVSSLGEMRLEVGATTEVVQVEAGAVPLMQADTPEITGHYESRIVSEVNFGTMGLDSIAFLTAGIVPGFGNINTNTGTGGQITGGGTAPAAAGQRSRSTQFNIDGHEINDISIGGPAIFINNQDSVAEYQVSVNNYDASQGRLPGAQINIITKSGTNDVHGTLYDFYESTGLRARTSAEARFNSDLPKFVLHNFGATAGGPLIKNKWFVFGSFQRGRIPDDSTAIAQGTALNMTQASAVALAAAFPNDSTRLFRDRGPFSILNGSPVCTPGTTRVFSGATSFGGVPVTACGITRSVPQGETFWEYSIRMDVALNKHNFTGKWYHQQDNFCCDGGSNGYWEAIPFNAWAISFGHTYQVTPRVINDFRFNAGRFFVAFEGGPTTIGGSFSGSTTEIRQNLARIQLPSGWNSFGLATNLPQGRLLYNFQWSDSVSYIRGRHTLKMGIEVRRNRTTAPFLPFVNGRYNYTGSTSSGTYSAFRTQVTTDAVSSVDFAEGPFTFQPFETDQFYFIQDDIRLRPNFTLNIGMRYEYTGQPVNTIHNETVARETGPAGLWNPVLTLAQRTYPRTSGDKNNWGPRIGFAYTPRIWKRLFGEDKTVIRGGYLIAYEAAFYNILLNISTAAPRVFLFNTTALNATGIQGGGTGATLAAAIAPPLGTRDPREFSRSNVPTSFHSPYTENWSFGIQREFRSNIVGEVRYVGNRQIGQFQSINANPRFSTFPASEVTPTGAVPCPAGSAPPTFLTTASRNRLFCDAGPLRTRMNGGQSIYHGLQSRLDFRNLWNQFTGGASFTWGKSIDNVSEVFGFFGAGSVAFSENPFEVNRQERGLSNFNLGRVFTAFWIWDIPFKREQQGVAGKILGGWQVNGELFMYDGRPWTPITFFGDAAGLGINCGQDTPFNSTFAGIFETCRPYLGNPAAPITTVGAVGDSTAHWWVNDGSAGFHGVGRNPNIFGDGLVLTNLGIFKNIKFGKENRYNLQFRFLSQNIFSHRNFGVPDNFIDDSEFFGLTGEDITFADPRKNDVPGRLIRLGLHFSF